MAIFGEARIKEKAQKKTKHKDLHIEAESLWLKRVKLVQMSVSAAGAIPKGFDKYLNVLVVNEITCTPGSDLHHSANYREQPYLEQHTSL